MLSFWIWLATFGKVRKDEFFGFLNFVAPKETTDFERSLQDAIDKGYVEVGQYQKILRASEEDPYPHWQSAGVLQAISTGIPPLIFAAFLRNQGVSNVDEFVREVEEMVGRHDLVAYGNGRVEHVVGNHPTHPTHYRGGNEVYS